MIHDKNLEELFKIVKNFFKAANVPMKVCQEEPAKMQSVTKLREATEKHKYIIVETHHRTEVYHRLEKMSFGNLITMIDANGTTDDKLQKDLEKATEVEKHVDDKNKKHTVFIYDTFLPIKDGFLQSILHTFPFPKFTAQRFVGKDQTLSKNLKSYRALSPVSKSAIDRDFLMFEIGELKNPLDTLRFCIKMLGLENLILADPEFDVKAFEGLGLKIFDLEEMSKRSVTEIYSAAVWGNIRPSQFHNVLNKINKAAAVFISTNISNLWGRGGSYRTLGPDIEMAEINAKKDRYLEFYLKKMAESGSSPESGNSPKAKTEEAAKAA